MSIWDLESDFPRTAILPAALSFSSRELGPLPSWSLSRQKLGMHGGRGGGRQRRGGGGAILASLCFCPEPPLRAGSHGLWGHRGGLPLSGLLASRSSVPGRPPGTPSQKTPGPLVLWGVGCMPGTSQTVGTMLPPGWDEGCFLEEGLLCWASEGDSRVAYVGSPPGFFLAEAPLFLRCPCLLASRPC